MCYICRRRSSCKEENRELLSQLGTVVYLWADADELVKRLSGDNTRPLLAGGNLKEKINTLMDARKEIYDSVSDIKIDTKDIALMICLVRWKSF